MRENVWKNYNEKEKEELEKLCADYMQFLSDCKTERECVKLGKKMADTCKIVKTDSTII